jgi:hypothetical protein
VTLPITPETKVGALLEAHPELEERLIELAPAFKKLKNPVLRRTVAKVATLAQAARVAGLNARELVTALREAAGQQPLGEVGPEASETAGQHPWIQSLQVVARIDAEQVLAAGTNPLQAVNAQLSSLGADEALAVTSSFVPVPLIDAVAARGFVCHTRTADGSTETLIARQRAHEGQASSLKS